MKLIDNTLKTTHYTNGNMIGVATVELTERELFHMFYMCSIYISERKDLMNLEEEKDMFKELRAIQMQVAEYGDKQRNIPAKEVFLPNLLTPYSQ
ncbi:hypothetical protein BKI52_12580 [marine bacterium AO1-C]|nr:hypothetical protein BKI52_12580 [marine bacterium AO1-C]